MMKVIAIIKNTDTFAIACSFFLDIADLLIAQVSDIQNLRQCQVPGIPAVVNTTSSILILM